MIHRLIFRAFVAATEDEDRVRKALSLFVPLESISRSSATGHYGNRILILEATLKEKEGLTFFELLKKGLPEPQLRRLQKEIQERIDDHCRFYLRLDKQAAYQGKVQLSESGDAIDLCAHIESYPAKPDKAAKIARELL